MSIYIDNLIDIPFNLRHHCWFCGEPNACYFSFPLCSIPKRSFHQTFIVLDCPHPSLTVPSCNECFKAANHVATKHELNSIWAVKNQVKRFLLKHYSKDLAIGIHWTKEELENSDFDGGNFAGFKKSAWFIYQVAQGRVNYPSWPLVIDGVDINENFLNELESDFDFDGVSYPSINDAVQHYSDAFSLNLNFLIEVVHYLGKDKFAQAVRFCRILVNATANERKAAFIELKSQTD